MIVLVGHDADGVANAAGIVSRLGWCCRTGESLAAAAVREDDILLHATGASFAPVSLPGATPTIALASAAWIATTDWTALGYVAAVDRGRLAADLPAALTDWCHEARLATLDRLAGIFGVAPIEHLLDGLRRTLQEALAGRGTATLATDAHRIAGLAGTLGFAAVGRHWQRIAEDPRPPSAATLLATRHALVTLERAKKYDGFTIS